METLPYVTLKELDIPDVEQKIFIVICDQHMTFKPGELLRLAQDDHTTAPIFHSYDTHYEEYVNINRLAIYDKENPQHAALRVKRKLLCVR